MTLPSGLGKKTGYASNFTDLGFQTNSSGLMTFYKSRVNKIIVNTGDKKVSSGEEVIETNTIMKTSEDSINLAKFICEL